MLQATKHRRLRVGKCKIMKLIVGQDDTFNNPEGKFRAILIRVGPPPKPLKKSCTTQVRLTFRTSLPSGKEHLVARTFCADLSFGSELHQFLNSWLGKELKTMADACGELDLNLLVDKQADLIIEHKHTAGHDDPYVNICGIFPRGTLVP